MAELVTINKGIETVWNDNGVETVTYPDGTKVIKDENGDVSVEKKNYFNVLNDIDVSDKIEKKNGLSYLSWAFAWGELKKKFPDATYKIYENNEGWNYFNDGRTCWVKTGVTVNDIEHIEYLPIMDYRNAAIPLDKVKSTDVNKAIQRSLTKACARHGVGLYVYAGEDLPEKVKEEKSKQEEFDKQVKEELKETINQYSKLFNKKPAEVLNILQLKHGKYNTWESEKIISIIDNLKEEISTNCEIID